MKAAVPRLRAVSHLDGWETQWDRLVDQAPLPSPFLRSWWLTGTGGPQRRFLLVADGERLIGGLALDGRGWPGLQILHMMGSGYLCPDHMDMVAAPREEQVTIGLLKDWFRRPGGRLVDLEGVPAHSRLTRDLRDRASVKSKRVCSCVQRPLKSTWPVANAALKPPSMSRFTPFT